MTINEEVRKKIASVLLQQRQNFDGSDAQYALSFDINKGVYARLKNNETERLLSDKKWITIARRLGVQLGDEPEWLPARTGVFEYITSQMTICKAESISSIYCDAAEVGKTEAAKYFCKTTKNSVYIDCSLHKSKQKLIRAIAQGFGLEHTGKYVDVFSDLVYYLKVIHKPFVALDEAGDLEYSAFLELKALWNGSEYCCAWYMLGADGLKKKLNRGKESKKVGFTEIISRYGSKYNRVTPVVDDERLEFWKDEAIAIIQANAPIGIDIQQLLLKSNGSHRALRTQILKLKRKSQLVNT
ncbi:AAA family ATPase [Niabella insulamsoli]|uniref:AAA family ATPase n=1 Tax=Niabella insulamsoli TaxID=3144874 RepID=UPI0031FE0388